ncbi:MAG: hypothetical protein K0M70_14350 [Arenimonas sp.]|uniref:hypothetical protein n=1 Tax=Arenimonas sp. TaxID=1872635 RepID=UPI0025B9AE85|nr:hypothetical protein [Arenimonas sp.]MBW8369025.1 hypothetical protein [Arenimonas sp.]
MLHADHGDCLWVEYGEADAPSPKRILIDCGTERTYREHLKAKIEQTVAAEGGVRFELFVVTHVDSDHIGGALRFLDDCAAPDSGVDIGEVWFNGYKHLDNHSPYELGGAQGELLSELLLRSDWDWNTSFGTRAVMVPDEGDLPQVDVAGMRLTLLSPDFARLQKLKPEWAENARKNGLTAGGRLPEDEAVLNDGWLGEDQSGAVDDLAASVFIQDSAKANGSSIAFIAEYDGERVLFGADAHPSMLLQSARREPLADLETVELAAFKLPHHGSRKNVSVAMLERFPAAHYLVSTTGQQFMHPDAPAIARVVHTASGRGACLHFNCRSDYNVRWDDADCQDEYGYSAVYGEDGTGLVVEIETESDP